MCGVIGIAGIRPVASALYNGLLLLQHRGQDAAGITTADGKRLYTHKGRGLVRDAFSESQMQSLLGLSGIAHCRYPTAGSCSDINEAQPFYVNSPYGVALGHNGNLTNHRELSDDLFRHDLRHINTGSDSEVLLNVFADELHQHIHAELSLSPSAVFAAVKGVFQRCQGAYAIVSLIAGWGMVAFRDPYGIRPLSIGLLETTDNNGKPCTEYAVASESAVLEGIGFTVIGDVAAGEAVFVDKHQQLHRAMCVDKPVEPHPCIFEYVYFARADSVMDGASVYQTRLNMGHALALQIQRLGLQHHIDVVMPIPDSGRPAALELSNVLKLPFREGFIKNRYIGRTFIMPGQTERKKSVRNKLHVLKQEFEGKRVALVDDSIVRGTTSQEIISMAREAGAREVYFISASPPVRHPNVYGIDMPTRTELIAHNRDADAVARILGADKVIYQELNDLIEAVKKENTSLQHFETSCFDGHYITPVSDMYLQQLEKDNA